jgi:hypothetical protein
MGAPLPHPDEHRKEDGRAHWVRPTLSYLGSLRDIVHGGGKSGPNADSDPQGSAKTGMG